MAYNLKNPAVKRILQEIKEVQADTSGDFIAAALENDIFEWHFIIRGPSETEFEGGIFHGRILLPAEYPFKPPAFMMLTPNGRFETNMKICLSISSHHPEQWQPSWSVRTALTALVAFMPTPGQGALGALDYTKEERQRLAARSRVEIPRFGSAERQKLIDEMHARMLAIAAQAPSTSSTAQAPAAAAAEAPAQAVSAPAEAAAAPAPPEAAAAAPETGSSEAQAGEAQGAGAAAAEGASSSPAAAAAAPAAASPAPTPVKAQAGAETSSSSLGAGSAPSLSPAVPKQEQLVQEEELQAPITNMSPAAFRAAPAAAASSPLPPTPLAAPPMSPHHAPAPYMHPAAAAAPAAVASPAGPDTRNLNILAAGLAMMIVAILFRKVLRVLEASGYSLPSF